MFLAAKRDVCLHRGTEGFDVTVRVLEREHVVAFRERIEVGVVLQIALGHFAVKHIAAALVSEEEILRQSIGFVPCVGRVFMRTGTLFRTG